MNCSAQLSIGLTTFKPPSLQGRASRARIDSFGGLVPEREGRNLEHIIVSRGRSSSVGSCSSK